MKIEDRLYFMRKVYRWLMMTSFIMAVIILFYAGPTLEAVLYPPISKFEIVEVIPAEDKTIIAGVLVKDRGTCVIESLNIFVRNDPDDYASKNVQVAFDVNDVYVTRPSGAQHWGPWTLTAPLRPLGPVVTISAIHRCHIIWKTETVLWSGLTEDIFPFHYDKETQNGIPLGTTVP